ncbi:MAG: type II toxin-antitoxin system VapB family antitoxin [Candidatus Hydrogenedentes bacterium]|nr:type II toxin-antitoxin system VapB family antitoxin [Candidatus Hydrogenedentota bacterium]
MRRVRAIDRLINEAMRLGRHKTKTEAVTAALAEYVRSFRRQDIFELVGRVEYLDDYDHQIGRRRKRG